MSRIAQGGEALEQNKKNLPRGNMAARAAGSTPEFFSFAKSFLCSTEASLLMSLQRQRFQSQNFTEV